MIKSTEHQCESLRATTTARCARPWWPLTSKRQVLIIILLKAYYIQAYSAVLIITMYYTVVMLVLVNKLTPECVEVNVYPKGANALARPSFFLVAGATK